MSEERFYAGHDVQPDVVPDGLLLRQRSFTLLQVGGVEHVLVPLPLRTQASLPRRPREAASSQSTSGSGMSD